MTGVTTWNKSITPSGSDGWNLTPDVRRAIETANVPVPVGSLTERDGLVPPTGKYAGMQVVRTDLPGCPVETWDGSAWQGVSWIPYSPSFAGWSNLGSGAVQTGSYLLLGKLCIVRAKLVGGGTGGSLGTGNLAVSLPYVSAPDQYSIGDALWYPVGSGGFPQRVMLANPPNNVQAAIVSNVAGSSTSQTPGNAGLNFGASSEVHCNITYRIG